MHFGTFLYGIDPFPAINGPNQNPYIVPKLFMPHLVPVDYILLCISFSLL